MMAKIRLCLSITLLLGLAGCFMPGPKSLEREHMGFNQVVQQGNDEEMLLNLIRLKYRDTPLFLKVSAINTQYSFQAGASASASVQNRNPKHGLGLGASASYKETPTVSYKPLQGDEFTQRMLNPIKLDSILLLARSGWSIERLLKLAAQSVNGIKNAPTASGPTPLLAPDYRSFGEAVKALRELQINNAISVGYAPGADVAVLSIQVPKGKAAAAATVRKLFHLGKRDAYAIAAGAGHGEDDTLYMETRSLMGILFYLSQAVEAPAAHRDAGLVTLTRDTEGKAFDWKAVTDPLFLIRSSEDYPEEAAVRVRYRGYWFYIDDRDLESKSTFTLVSQLFALQAGKIEGAVPVLTLPLQ